MMSRPSNYRLLVLVACGAALAACSQTEQTIVGVQSPTAVSLTASEMSVAYLPMPEGVKVSGFSPASSPAGFIFSSATGTVPYAWSSPYAQAAQPVGPQGYIGLDDGNDLGDIRGNVNGAGFWKRGTSDWQFVYVNVGSYAGVSAATVNNARSLAGFGSRDGLQRALWWSDASAEPVELPVPPLTGTCIGARALAMNNVGDIVGEITERIVVNRKTQTRVHAVIWKPAALGWQPMLLKDVGTENRAYDVNDAGQVAGNSSGNAVLWTPSDGLYGAPVIVSTSQGALTKVDRCGRVVGYTSGTTPSKRKAWVWENGVLTHLPFPTGAIATLASTIMTDLTTGEGVIAGGAMPSGQGNDNSAFLPIRWTLSGCT